MQQLQFKSCDYDAWQCKCHGQKKILTCYDNCPSLEARTLQEMQVEVFCGPLNGKIYDKETIDKMMRPAKLTQHPTHATSSASSASPKSTHGPTKTSSEPPDRDKRISARSTANYSVLDAAAPPRTQAPTVPIALAAAAAAMALIPLL
ncbi:hypothetical protein H4R19_003000 [Coemansia spiralis]|nr:hypothetical protein H4R19_003000 [Coemansia spiralis]